MSAVAEYPTVYEFTELYGAPRYIVHRLDPRQLVTVCGTKTRAQVVDADQTLAEYTEMPCELGCPEE